MATFPCRGEAWLVGFPDDPKTRPALIVSVDACNEFASSALAAPVTANLRPSPTHVLLPAA
jgi:mRNA-degrading endonuclease toxin of MazEF toxin-antitoxin module